MARSFTIGSAQDITVPQHSLINALFATGGTIMGWVNASAIDGGGSRILDKGENQNDGWTLIWGSDGSLNFRHTWSTTGVNVSSGASALSLGAWQFVAVTYNGSSTTNNPELWVNETKYTPNPSPLGTIDDDSARNLYIASRDGTARFITALIAEVSMWKAILSDDELIALARGCNPFRIRSANRGLYMPLWGVHDPEINLVSGGNTGSLDNSPPRVAGPPVEPFSRRWWGTTSLIETAPPGDGTPMHYYRRRRAG